MPNNTDNLDTILHEFGLYYPVSTKEERQKATSEAKQKIEALYSQQLSAAVKEANSKGHWKVSEVFTDPGYKFICNCGYSTKERFAIDGHIEWMLAALN